MRWSGEENRSVKWLIVDGGREGKGKGECGCGYLWVWVALNGHLNGIDWNCDSRWVCPSVVSIWRRFLFATVWGMMRTESGSVIQGEWLFQGQCEYCGASTYCWRYIAWNSWKWISSTMLYPVLFWTLELIQSYSAWKSIILFLTNCICISTNGVKRLREWMNTFTIFFISLLWRMPLCEADGCYEKAVYGSSYCGLHAYMEDGADSDTAVAGGVVWSACDTNTLNTGLALTDALSSACTTEAGRDFVSTTGAVVSGVASTLVQAFKVMDFFSNWWRFIICGVLCVSWMNWHLVYWQAIRWTRLKEETMTVLRHSIFSEKGTIHYISSQQTHRIKEQITPPSLSSLQQPFPPRLLASAHSDYTSLSSPTTHSASNTIMFCNT